MGGAAWRRLLRLPVGLLGIVALVVVLASVGGTDTLPQLAGIWATMATLAFWISGLAPLAFVRLGLASTASEPCRTRAVVRAQAVTLAQFTASWPQGHDPMEGTFAYTGRLHHVRYEPGDPAPDSPMEMVEKLREIALTYD